MGYFEFVCLDQSFGNKFPFFGWSELEPTWILFKQIFWILISAFLNCGQPRKIHKSHKKWVSGLFSTRLQCVWSTEPIMLIQFRSSIMSLLWFWKFTYHVQKRKFAFIMHLSLYHCTNGVYCILKTLKSDKKLVRAVCFILSRG